MRSTTRFERYRARRRSEDGFALMVVLFVIALVSLLVIALIGMSFATSGFSAGQSVRDRRARAADAALQASINQIAGDATGNLAFGYGEPTGPDADCTVPTLGTLGEAHIDVAVLCEALEGTDSLVGVAPTNLSGPDLRVVGTSSGGSLAGSWQTTSTAANAFPWASVLGALDSSASRAAVNGYQPTVLHRGNEPLSISGNLKVSNGGVMAINEGAVRDDPLDSALTVTGGLHQSSAGLFAGAGAVRDTASPAYLATDLSNSCGVLQPVALVPAWKISTVAVRAYGGMSCTETIGALNSAPAPTRWGPVELDAARRTVGACPAVNGTLTLSPGAYTKSETAKLNQMWSGTCPNRSFVFEPGDYWFDVEDPALPVDSTDPAAPTRNALRIADPTVRIVFGRPRTSALNGSGLVAAEYPNVCTGAAGDGVTITLSARTSLRHVAGRVAICGKGPGASTVWQVSDSELGTVKGADEVIGTPGGYSIPTNALLFDDATGENDLVHVANGLHKCATFGNACTRTLSLTMPTLGANVPDVSAPVHSAQLVVRGWAFTADGFSSSTTVTLNRANGTRLCSDTFSGVPVRGELTVYELLDKSSNCGRAITDRVQLRNATVRLDFNYVSICDGVTSLFDFFTDAASLFSERVNRCLWQDVFSSGDSPKVDYVALRLPWILGVARSGSGPAEPCPTSPPSNLCPTDVQVTRGRVEGTPARMAGLNQAYENSTPLRIRFDLNGQNPLDHTVTIRTVLDDSLNPDLSNASTGATTLGSAWVKFVGQSTFVEQRETTTRLRLQGPSINCSATYQNRGTVANKQHGGGIAFDLLDARAVNNTCRGALTQPSQLVGATLIADMFVAPAEFCESLLFGLIRFCRTSDAEGLRDLEPISDYGWGIDIDQIQVTTTTSGSSTYVGPTSSMTVTSNDAPGTSGDAVFSLLGQLSLPRADLDVRWTGPTSVGIADVPAEGSRVVAPLVIASGPQAMTVKSINSEGSAAGTVGVLCCAGAKPTDRRFRLEVQVLPSRKIIGTAVVRVEDVDPNPSAPVWDAGQRVTVQRYSLCPTGVTDPSLCESV